MSEVKKSEGGMGKLKAYGILGATAFGGLWLLSTAGLVGTAVIGTLGVAGTAAYGAYTGGLDGAVSNVKSLFSKIGSTLSEAFGVAKSGFTSAKEWAETQEASRTVDTGAPAVSTKESAPDFAKAANVNAPAAKVAKPAPAQTQKLG